MRTRAWQMEDGGWRGRSWGGRAGSPQPAAARWGHRALPVVILLLALLTVALSASAQSYSIDWYKISGGGGASTGGVYAVSGTIGQPDAGAAMSGGNYSVTGGFWSLVAVVQTPAAPALSVTHAGNSVIVSWPYPSSGWALQQNPSVANAAGWQTSAFTVTTNAAVNRITITAPAGNLFFRLSSP